MIIHLPRPWATWCLLASLATAYALQQLAGDQVARLALQPAAFEWWQLLSYALLHSSLGHLLANAACFAYFGAGVEFALGRWRYLVLLASCAAGGGLCQVVAAWLPWSGAAPAIATVGASAAVYGLLVAGWQIWPRDPVRRATAVVYGALALAAVVTGGGGSVAVYAHLAGMAVGGLVLACLRVRAPGRVVTCPGTAAPSPTARSRG